MNTSLIINYPLTVIGAQILSYPRVSVLILAKCVCSEHIVPISLIEGIVLFVIIQEISRRYESLGGCEWPRRAVPTASITDQ